MHRPIPGARFFASVLAGASLFGGAAALADAGRLGVSHIVNVPVAAAEQAVLAPVTEEEAKAADALAKDVAKAAAAALSGRAAPVESAAALAGAGLPRLRPQPPAEDNAG